VEVLGEEVLEEPIGEVSEVPLGEEVIEAPGPGAAEDLGVEGEGAEWALVARARLKPPSSLARNRSGVTHIFLHRSPPPPYACDTYIDFCKFTTDSQRSLLPNNRFAAGILGILCV